MENKAASQSPVDRIWKFFSSITLAVVVFTIISLTSIVGTIIEQGGEPERNIKIIAKFVGVEAAPGVFKALDAMGFTDMFASWWFMGLLFIFAANLVVCSIERLPRIWKLVKEPVKPLSDEQWAAFPSRKELTLKAAPDKAGETAAAALRKIGYKATLHGEGANLQLYAEKGRYSRLGVYVTHLSILVILIGAVVGTKFGFSGHVNILEGDAASAAFRAGGQEIPLGFDVRCDDFEVSFYPDSDTPKDFRSWLTVIDGGREVMKKEITVNDPLSYKGITFYQSSYGFSPSNRSRFILSVTTPDGKTQPLNLRFGESFTVPGTSMTGTVADFSPALGIDPSGKLYTYADTMNNPAVFIQYSEGGKPRFTQWALKRYPETWQTPFAVVQFKDLWAAQYTGLQVRKDPGVWIVYLGCLIMAIGLYAAFFMSHSRVWVGLKGEKNATRLTITGSINKHRIGLDRKLDLLVRDLQEKS